MQRLILVPSSIVTSLLVASCDFGTCPCMPDESYAMPTAILGLPINSGREAAAVRLTVKDIATRYGLIPYTQRDVAFFADKCRQSPRTCPDQYLPRNPRMRDGFGITLDELSDQCFLMELYEYSGIWTERSLRALNDLQKDLGDVSEHTAQLLVRPKPEQNWPMQKTMGDPEMPDHREALCARMGLEDPRRHPDNRT